MLVEAMAAARPSIRARTASIVGGVHRAGESYAADAARARRARSGLTTRVHFAGFRDDIPDVMNAWDVVVHASVRPEPFGRVILEGMLLGKPVIATAAGGVPRADRATGDTGFLVPPGDAAALARVSAPPARPRRTKRSAVGARARDLGARALLAQPARRRNERDLRSVARVH